MEKETVPRLRVLVTDGPGVRLDEVTRTVAELGHEVVARESSLLEVAHITAAEHPDVALVIVHEGNTKGLQMIDRIVHESACPVIAVIDVEDREFVNEAAKRGIFAYIARGRDPQEMRAPSTSSCDASPSITLSKVPSGGEPSRSGRRGSLMERHGIDEETAFNMLRDQARRTHRKIVDLAEAVVTGQPVLPLEAPRHARTLIRRQPRRSNDLIFRSRSFPFASTWLGYWLKNRSRREEGVVRPALCLTARSKSGTRRRQAVSSLSQRRTNAPA